MLLVGLTGGIGSGKSTVARGLARRGAAVVEADRVGREILERVGAAYPAVVARFGAGIVGPDGSINRPALAAIVFGDAVALADLNSLTHPVIGRVMADQAKELGASHDIVVLDVALLSIVTKDLFQLAAIIAVDVPEDIAVARLVNQRGFSEEDAWARVAAQISREDRRQAVDLILDNSGDEAALEGEIDRAWTWLQARVAEAAPTAPSAPA